MADNLPEPKSRKESYLAKAAGMDTTIPDAPESREEQYLAAIAEGGGGGGGSYTAGTGIDISSNTISVDTQTIQEKLTAGTNITIADNVISATGGGGESIRELTVDDYNWNLTLNSATEPYDCVALWLMPAGWYSKSEGSTVAVAKHANPYGIEMFSIGTYFVGVTEGTGANARRPYLYSTYSDKTHWYQSDIDPSTGREYDNAKMLTAADLTIVQSTGSSTTDVMSQKAVTDIVGDVASALNAINNGTQS